MNKIAMDSVRDVSRRRLLAGMGGLAGSLVVGCGGGGPEEGESASAAPAVIQVETNVASATGSTSIATLRNGAGGKISLWSDAGTVSQSLYEGGGATIRTFHGASGAIERIVNESTRDFLTVVAVNADRTDFNLYNASGAWQAGWAVLRNADGTYATAPILSSSGLQGQQISGHLSGGVVAAFSMLPDGRSGLGSATPLTTSANVFALARRPDTALAWLDLLTDRLFSAAHAQTFTASNLLELVKGVFFGAAGALVYTSTLPAAPLLGAAIMGYGAYRIYQELTRVANTNLDSLDSASSSILGGAFDEFAANRGSAIDSIASTVSNYLSRGATVLSGRTSLADAASRASLTVSNAASTLGSVASTPWQAVTNGPPAGSTLLQGLLVDNAGQSFPTTGSFNPADHSLTIDTGPAGGRRISGSGTADTDSGSGTYTIVTNGSPSGSGTFTARRRSLGACQTQQSSGGQGAFTHVYDLGKDAGTFQLDYQMYSIPDRLEVRSSTGSVLYSTGGLVAGSNTVDVTYSGGRMVYVVISAPTSGTAWDYRIGCP